MSDLADNVERFAANGAVHYAEFLAAAFGRDHALAAARGQIIGLQAFIDAVKRTTATEAEEPC